MKALITGSEGFVGSYLRRELEHSGYDVLGLDLRAGAGTVKADLLDAAELAAIVGGERPDTVFHLAGQADVGLSWKDPAGTFERNVIASTNLLDAVRTSAPGARVVIVGSSDQYGDPGDAGKAISEETPLRPVSPYAVSKTAQELMAKTYAKAYGMNVVMTRSFNHCGAGQRKGFIISDFASGIAEIENGRTDCLRIGNLDSTRDFTHVSDVVRAYRLLAEKGRNGEVYNVGSGCAHTGKEILETFLSMSAAEIRIEKDPLRMRPSDVPVICCDNGKLRRDTGWKPEVSFKDMLRDVLDFWRRGEKTDNRTI